MKYLLIILLFVSSFCYGQKNEMEIREYSNPQILPNKISKHSSGRVDTSRYNDFVTLQQVLDSIAILTSPKYDTSFGIIEVFLRDGVLVRGFGFKIDSLETITHAKNTPSAVYIPITDTIHHTLKAFFQPCSCFIDTKKYYRFIPLESFQDIDIYEDEHISISPNENYKK